jgi:hypothetical protein
MMEIAMSFSQSPLVPARVALGAKEICAHVVVDSIDLPSK